MRVGGPDCTQPYDMALPNVSAMSFGALSANAIRALNRGAALGGFAHDSGEGGSGAAPPEFEDYVGMPLTDGLITLHNALAGVETQDPRRFRALDETDESERVRRFQEATVAEAQQIIVSMGLDGPQQLCPGMLMRRINHHAVHSFAKVYEWLEPGQVLAEPPQSRAADWTTADPDRFGLAPIMVPNGR